MQKQGKSQKTIKMAELYLGKPSLNKYGEEIFNLR